jgi:hypothetical protein
MPNTYTFTPTIITRPGEQPESIDANFLSIEEIEALAFESPKGTTISTRRGVFTCVHVADDFALWAHPTGNVAGAFLIHVIITEFLPVV